MRFSQSRILYVDDDKDACEMISFLLGHSDENYAVTSVFTAKEASALIANQTFDLYILDYALPEISGVEFCRLIREKDGKTPILFYSAMSRPVDRELGLAAGANDYLIKPNDLERFTETVKRLLNKRLSSFKRESSTNLRIDKNIFRVDINLF